MFRLGRFVAVALSLALLSGCGFVMPRASQTPFVIPTPQVTAIGGIEVSSVPGVAVDRPIFPGKIVASLYKSSPGGGLAGYQQQTPDWGGCAEKLGEDASKAIRCAEVLVPENYSDPDGRAISLFMAKWPASKEPHLGTLFVNPGGPGGSGSELVTYFERKELKQFDIIGWDPRGAGLSTPVKCLSDEELDEMNEVDISPDDEDEQAALIASIYKFTKGCWENNGDYLRHIGTTNTVRDLELLRTIIGDEKLNYLGYSAGSELGARYAQAFPEQVGRLVLDGAGALEEEDKVPQITGFESSVNHLAKWCAKSEDCSLGDSEAAVIGKITEILDQLEDKPIKVEERTLTQSMAVNAMFVSLYWGEAGWETLTEAITDALDGNGRDLLWLADEGAYRSQDGSYDQMAVSFPAIDCLQESDEGVLAANEEWKADQKLAPILGKYAGPYYICALWPVKPDTNWPISETPLATEILIVGNTGDNATPYQQAVSMAERLGTGVLLTHEGEGHTSFGRESKCVDRAVVDFLTKGKLPPPGLRCSN